MMITLSILLGGFALLVFDVDMSLLLPENGTITPEQGKMFRLGVAVGSILHGLVVLFVGFVINYVATRKVRRQARLENQSLQGKVNR